MGDKGGTPRRQIRAGETFPVSFRYFPEDVFPNGNLPAGESIVDAPAPTIGAINRRTKQDSTADVIDGPAVVTVQADESTKIFVVVTGGDLAGTEHRVTVTSTLDPSGAIYQDELILEVIDPDDC